MLIPQHSVADRSATRIAEITTWLNILNTASQSLLEIARASGLTYSLAVSQAARPEWLRYKRIMKQISESENQ